jgi:hypothetical protein
MWGRAVRADACGARAFRSGGWKEFGDGKADRIRSEGYRGHEQGYRGPVQSGELLRRIVEKAVEASNSVAGRFYVISETGSPEIAAEVRQRGEALKVSERLVRAAARVGRDDTGPDAVPHGGELYVPVNGRGGCVGVVYVRKTRGSENMSRVISRFSRRFWRRHRPRWRTLFST